MGALPAGGVAAHGLRGALIGRKATAIVKNRSALFRSEIPKTSIKSRYINDKFDSMGIGHSILSSVNSTASILLKTTKIEGKDECK